MMQGNFIVHYSEEAQLDLLNAVKQNNGINSVLGKRLKREIKNLEIQILSNPPFASIKYRMLELYPVKFFLTLFIMKLMQKDTKF